MFGSNPLSVNYRKKLFLKVGKVLPYKHEKRLSNLLKIVIGSHNAKIKGLWPLMEGSGSKAYGVRGGDMDAINNVTWGNEFIGANLFIHPLGSYFYSDAPNVKGISGASTIGWFTVWMGSPNWNGHLGSFANNGYGANHAGQSIGGQPGSYSTIAWPPARLDEYTGPLPPPSPPIKYVFRARFTGGGTQIFSAWVNKTQAGAGAPRVGIAGPTSIVGATAINERAALGQGGLSTFSNFSDTSTYVHVVYAGVLSEKEHNRIVDALLEYSNGF
ncbi:MAG: hypothetical protein HC836_12710 [Richelia sp. RM2_1_2]|nr:hypothetical protein [Richelia sp. RM2_1_2]